MKIGKFADKVRDIVNFSEDSKHGSVFWLCEESGEVAKIFKHETKTPDTIDPEELKAELGDVLVALASVANANNIDLDEAATEALEKWKEKFDK